MGVLFCFEGVVGVLVHLYFTAFQPLRSHLDRQAVNSGQLIALDGKRRLATAFAFAEGHGPVVQGGADAELRQFRRELIRRLGADQEKKEKTNNTPVIRRACIVGSFFDDEWMNQIYLKQGIFPTEEISSLFSAVPVILRQPD